MSHAEPIRSMRKQGEHEAAMNLAVELASQWPSDAEVQYEAACVHDFLGHEATAVPFYLAAIGAGLAGEKLRGAYLGLGSTYRVLGQHERALATFDEGLGRFPGAAELVVFKAMALYNSGNGKQAIQSLLEVIAKCSSDPQLQEYSKAISFYAKDIERQWS